MFIFVDMINWLIDALVLVITGVMSLFPKSPFQFHDFDWGPFGMLVGLVFPAGDMFIHFNLILVAVGSYYAIRLLLRWIKMIR